MGWMSRLKLIGASAANARDAISVKRSRQTSVRRCMAIGSGRQTGHLVIEVVNRKGCTTSGACCAIFLSNIVRMIRRPGHVPCLVILLLLPLTGGCTKFQVLDALVPACGYARTADLAYGELPR